MKHVREAVYTHIIPYTNISKYHINPNQSSSYFLQTRNFFDNNTIITPTKSRRLFGYNIVC